MKRHFFFSILILSLWPLGASAQYRNQSFGLDAGGWLLTKPSLVDDSGALLAVDKIPLRLSNGFGLGGETNFKMAQDRWWFSARVRFGFLQYAVNDFGTATEIEFDREARKTLGTLLGIEGGMGVRYMFMTDRVRPYLQLGLSYMRLMTFSSSASSTCDPTLDLVCGGDTSYETLFLPHPNVGGLNGQFGVEITMMRNVALHLFSNAGRWLVLNAADNHTVFLGLGVIFFT